MIMLRKMRMTAASTRMDYRWIIASYDCHPGSAVESDRLSHASLDLAQCLHLRPSSSTQSAVKRHGLLVQSPRPTKPWARLNI